ncbi:MAG: aryldialkylphosphatase [Acidimicrobiia bacterium]|nr:aryldialkylphosphatase [Acidimicrobiia bacterium]
MIRTALGDIDSAELGRTNYHEHLFQVSPLLRGDELDDEQLSGDEGALLHEAGIDAMVDATPTGLGRDPEGVARISARTGLHVVLTTGAHRRPHYGDEHWLLRLSVDELAQRFTNDLDEGMPAVDTPEGQTPAVAPSGGPIRAGILKAGIGYWEIGSFERSVIEAICVAHDATNAPVMVHLEYGSAAFEVLALLGDGGVEADRVVLAHADRNPDAGLHRELATVGAYLGYDGVARHRNWPDSALIQLIEDVAASSLDRIVLGGDVARRTRYVAYGGMPGLAYLPERFLPRLEAVVGHELVATIMIENPRRLLDWASASRFPA